MLYYKKDLFLIHFILFSMESPFLSQTTHKKKVSQKISSSSFLISQRKKERKKSSDTIPVTIFTGYLGAGKTTVITNLIKKMPPDYRIAWLKNEMGNTAIDTELAEESRTATVKEMLQGCICHVMIGQLSSALDEMVTSHPQRIIIETSGSATPAPVVWQIRDHPHLRMDGVITVIDAKNFKGYLRKSPTLKMQAKYTDLILINKHEDLDEKTLENNLDDLYEINLDTPKIQTDHGSVSPEIIFGLDSKLFLEKDSSEKDVSADHHSYEVDIIEIRPSSQFAQETLSPLLKNFPKEHFYRIKGVLETRDKPLLLNFSFGDFTFTSLSTMKGVSRVVFMGEDIFKYKKLIATSFRVPEESLHFIPKKHIPQKNHSHKENL
ncbi:MAG: hypothetical protein EOM19_03540 [Candidatus Moranbacteria bacterium]|nr:hypothetical protein [Candidatus Moranbacteria bacterium]